jgi:4-alpha-glucanotransferase
MHRSRSSGLLLHITSLPGPYGIGDLGPGAYRFADFLAEAGQSLWQVLPLVPAGLGHSPYSSPSTFAGNPMLISPAILLEQGLLVEDDIADHPEFPDDFVDFDNVLPLKERLLGIAFNRFETGESRVDQAAFRAYCHSEDHWLNDYAQFMALKERFEGAVWTEWPEALALRHEPTLARFAEESQAVIRRHQFWQFLFHQQWQALRAYCHTRSIQIFGDLPIYVAHDSADVWAEPHLFHLDKTGHPTVVAGVPPDYFSETGQRWGNPIYRWDLMRENGYSWWTRRMRSVLEQVDLVRLDHFRAFDAYWEIDSSCETAVEGRWVKGPGADLFNALKSHLGDLPVVAEDLGLITEEVRALMRQFDFPGMAVLQFAFGNKTDHPFLPHNYPERVAAYTGTHDNDTFVGWYESLSAAAEERQRKHAAAYLNPHDLSTLPVHMEAIRLVMNSHAELAIFPLQDLLGLGQEARMNVPGRPEHNWAWRFPARLLGSEEARTLRRLTVLSGRAPQGHDPLMAF